MPLTSDLVCEMVDNMTVEELFEKFPTGLNGEFTFEIFSHLVIKVFTKKIFY